METPLYGLVDSHFHLLAIREKGIEPSPLLATMNELGYRGIDIGLGGNDLKERIELVGTYSDIYFAAGLGPWAAAWEDWKIKEALHLLYSDLSRHPVLAVGEIGLDNYWKYGTRERQEAIFLAQADLGKPIIIHNREADEQFIGLLSQHSFPRGGIFHCFSGSEELALLALEKGFYLSFAGSLTYKGSQPLIALMKRMPKERLLLETDSPYLAPIPKRGKKNIPLYIEHLYRFVANKLELPVETLIRLVSSNFQRFVDEAKVDRF
ncbi:MAG TPA: TatD family hydrolase [Sphaerochaeta sp.]|jgi:TatD DNase family protein|nr:TatD family hydrolase [Sphaerochaeta sp.]HQB54348.1 TatD family hydrolase [Sphaerochaeta sp.]